ncbi:MAG: hypothetical protein K5776_13590 [Lachnospiraceae bacterium]|nr:hypothetical protein [Lachnospiraceae bacterium]
MENNNWKLIAIINTMLTLALVIALCAITFYYRNMMDAKRHIEASNTRVEFHYITKIFDNVEFVYPLYGILRDTETNEDVVLDSFDIIEKVDSNDEIDKYAVSISVTNYGGENINVYFDEYDSEGNYVDQFFTQFDVTQGTRFDGMKVIDIDKNASKIEIRLQENAVLEFGD